MSDDQAKPIENPKYLRRGERALKKAQRRVSRRIKGSQRRRKAVRLLARQHLRVKRQRRDFHFKEAKKLVDRYQSIKVEDLKVKNLVKNHHLAKSISDAGWSQFIMIVMDKAAEAPSEGDQGESSLYITGLLALRKSEPDHISDANLSLLKLRTGHPSRPQQRQEDRTKGTGSPFAEAEGCFRR